MEETEEYVPPARDPKQFRPWDFRGMGFPWLVEERGWQVTTPPIVARPFPGVNRMCAKSDC